ncbi:MAG: flagellin [Alphaproteobacteria bacterium]|nr:flagellin [Alphaproteobacteria bacterium]
MAERISLSAAIRSNLLTLNRTAELGDRTQERLASGLKVNSALDDASAFFAAASLNNRADDLLGLKDSIDQSISTLEAAINGIEAITQLVEQAKGLAVTAKATSDLTQRATLATQFDALLSQINGLSNDASYNGTNLISTAPDNLTVTFNEDSTSTLTVLGIDTSATGLNVGTAIASFALDVFIDIALTQVDTAIATLRTSAATLGSNSTVLQTRLNFTQGLANTLEEGSGKLTLADLNEESANALSLETRQQLGLNSLSLAAQSEQAILNLFS